MKPGSLKRCSYCFYYDNDGKGEVELTPDGGRTWQRGGLLCVRCRDYLTGVWRHRQTQNIDTNA